MLTPNIYATQLQRQIDVREEADRLPSNPSYLVRAGRGNVYSLTLAELRVARRRGPLLCEVIGLDTPEARAALPD